MKTGLHLLILASFAVFFGSMMLSARAMFAGKPVDLRDALISFLLSPSDNPNGYRIAIVGTALCGALLLPVAYLFYRKLSARNRPLAFIGSLIFGLGPLSAVSMIFLTQTIDDLHVRLAFAAYIFMTLGLLICLALEGYFIIRGGGIAAFAMLAALVSLLIVLVLIFCLLFNDNFFGHTSLLASVAFDEWALCAIVAAGISGLAMLLGRATR